MSTLSWNCRGMAAVATLRELKNLCKSLQPSILFLMETRAPGVRIERMRRSLKFKYAFWVDSMGLSGGLGLFWRDNIDIQVLFSSQNVIHSAVVLKESGDAFECSFIYGNPIYQQRRYLWSRIADLQPHLNKPWCCIGDFNEILAQHEKDGRRIQQTGRMENFRHFIKQSGLMDLDLNGCKYTWVSNPREGFVTREKLDSVFELAV